MQEVINHVEAKLSVQLHGIAVGQENLKSVISLLPEMTQEQRVELARDIKTTEQLSWLVRGGCAYHYVQTAVEPLKGGRGKRDVNGDGVVAAMSKMATEVGVDRKTLETESRIYQRFFLTGKIDPEAEILPKEFYTISLTAHEKAEEAIELAQSRHDSDPKFSSRQFRDVINEMKGGTNPTELENIYFLSSIGICTEAKTAMDYLCRHYNRKPGQIIETLLLQEYDQVRLDLDAESKNKTG